jgi:hypothetical protein
MTQAKDIAAYIQALARELAVMAKRGRLAELAHLLAMAELQAGQDAQ